VIIADVITEVRRLIQDQDEPFRFSDEVLLGYVNQTLQRTALLRPDLFARVITLPTTPNEVIQSAPQDSIRIMDVFRVEGGDGIVEVSKTSLDQTYPQWVNDPARPCINWMRHGRNPNKFFIYPKAPAGQELVVEYSQTPRNYQVNDKVELLPEAYFPVIIDGAVYLSQSIDDESVLNQRAQMFLQSYLSVLGANVQTRVMTDSDEPNAGIQEGSMISE
jgi:hypothetical protein